MSVEFYRKGDQRDINGLMCDVMLVAPEMFDGRNLPAGWFLSAKDAYRPTKTEAEEIESARLATQQKAIDNSFIETEDAKEVDSEIQIETKKEEPEAEKTEEVKALKGNAKIRNDAKEAGIEDWETARIVTLNKKLKV